MDFESQPMGKLRPMLVVMVLVVEGQEELFYWMLKRLLLTCWSESLEEMVPGPQRAMDLVEQEVEVLYGTVGLLCL
jgi:hypothetical protein